MEIILNVYFLYTNIFFLCTGWIYDAMGSYDLAFHIAGIPMIMGAVTLFLIPWAKMTSTGCNDLAGAQSIFGIESVTTISGTSIEKGQGVLTTDLEYSYGKKQKEEDAHTLTPQDSCIVVNLKKGTIQRIGRTRYDSSSSRETEEEPELGTLHEIAQAIEILSHHSASMFSFDVRSMVSTREPSHIVPADYAMAHSPMFPMTSRGVSPQPGTSRQTSSNRLAGFQVSL